MQRHWEVAAVALTAVCLQQGVLARSEKSSLIEEITVIDKAMDRSPLMSVDTDVRATDAGELVDSLPGVGINRNGPVTGILQYRGLSGDRIAVQLDHGPTLTGGPNGMDSPLSYISPLLLDDMEMVRGIVPVSVPGESPGGSLDAELDRGEFANSPAFEFSGAAHLGWSTNPAGESHAVRATTANNSHKLTFLGAYDHGDDTEAGDDERIGGTRYLRERYDLGYGYQRGTTELEIHAGRLDTRNTGTPALPMDIAVIDTDMLGMNLTTEWAGLTIEAHLGTKDVYHEMDNFGLRRPPASPVQYRFTEADAENTSWQLSASGSAGSATFSLGLDGNHTRHDADITNPNNGAFLIENFNNVERDVTGVFMEAENQWQRWRLSGGIRYNRVAMNSDRVSTAGLPGMMAMGAGMLAENFNDSDRDERFHMLDAVIKAQYRVNDRLALTFGLGRKNQAPSYQQRYLWLPLPATGGLADGRNYIGNSDLDAETNHETTLGLTWTTERLTLSPELFYRRVDNYIQGVPSNNETANMLAMMMTDKPALMFDNIDAQLTGIDGQWQYRLTPHWSLEGTVSWVQGERRDADDNLYRIAPFSNRVALTWQDDDNRISLVSEAHAEQDDVSSFNDERPTSGYGLIHLRARIGIGDDLVVHLQADNLLDQHAPLHLGGYNRNADSDIPLGDRIPASGRNLSAGIQWRW